MLASTVINRIIVEMPVRHGKSWFSSFCLPSWIRIKRPNWHIGVISYGGEFAGEWSSKIRDLVKEWGPQINGIGLHPDIQSKTFFRMAPPYIGELRGTGIGGSIAGKGFHFVVCDDLVKEFSEVATEEARDKMYRDFHGEVLNRLEPGAKVMIVMSRRHPDDLSGRLLASNEQLEPEHHWHKITIPALSDDGVALWPERYPAKKLLAIKRDYEASGQPWIWHSLYQQDPATAAELCEWPATYWADPFWFNPADMPRFRPKFRLMYLDPSKGVTTKPGDFAALLYGVVDPNDCLWLVDVKMLRIPLDDLEDTAVAMLRQYKPDAFGVEANGFQEYVATNIHRKAPTMAPIFPYVNTRSEAISALSRGKIPGQSVAGRGKEVDIRMILSPILNLHNVRICDTPQGRILGQQLRDFPLAKYDDGPDALCGMVRLWRDLLGHRPQTAGQKILTS
jgi:hypothetical protein